VIVSDVLSSRIGRLIASPSFWLAITGFLALVLSGSRGIWFSALGTAILIVFAYEWTRRKVPDSRIKLLSKQLLALFMLFGVLFLPASLLSSLSQKAQGAKADTFASLKRAKSIADFEELSNRSRLGIWKIGIRTMTEYPVLGVGFGHFSVALGEDIGASKRGASAHNLYLDIGSETGIPGLALFLAIVILVFHGAGNKFSRLRLRGSEETQGRQSGETLAFVFLIYSVWILGYSFFDIVLLNDKVLIAAVVLAALSTDSNADTDARTCMKVS